MTTFIPDENAPLLIEITPMPGTAVSITPIFAAHRRGGLFTAGEYRIYEADVRITREADE